MGNDCTYEQITTGSVAKPNARAAAVRLYWRLRMAVASPLLVLYCITNQKEIIRLDTAEWIRRLLKRRYSGVTDILYLLVKCIEFRNLYYHRVINGNIPGAIAAIFLRVFYRPCGTLYLNGLCIGPGFFIQHGYATSVSAKFGKNCSVNQSVAVGWGNGDRPPIVGDNVSVKVGAKVLGAITIGDNVTIGANCVVVKDVPPNCTVVGVPARIVRRNGVRVDEPL